MVTLPTNMMDIDYEDYYWLSQQQPADPQAVRADDYLDHAGEGGEGDSVVPVPGFGFLPRPFYSQFLNLSRTLQLDRLFPDQVEANDTFRRNSAKCDIVVQLFQAGVLPFAEGDNDDASSSSSRLCAPLFDGASCIPATPPGTLRVIPCMYSYAGVQYDTSGKKKKSIFPPAFTYYYMARDRPPCLLVVSMLKNCFHSAPRILHSAALVRGGERCDLIIQDDELSRLLASFSYPPTLVLTQGRAET